MIVVMALLLFVGTGFWASTTPRTAAPLYGLVLVLALLWAAKLVVAEAISWKKSLMHLPVAGFAVYALIRYFTSPIEYESRIELFQVGVCTLVYFLAVSNFRHSRDRSVLVLAMVVLGMAQAVYGIYQYATHATTIFGLARPEGYFNRAGGTFMCPNHLAGFLEMVLCVMVARLAMHSSSKLSLERLALEKVFLAFGIFVVMVGLLATLSRGGWLSAVVGLSVLLLLGGWTWSRVWPRVLVGALGVGLLMFLAFKVEGLSSRFIHSVTLVKGKEGNSVNLDVSTLGPRLKIYEATLKMVWERPVWGTGGNTWQWFYPKYRPDKVPGNPEYVHNDYLNLLSDYGLVGFALVALALACFYVHAFRLSRSDNTPEERAFVVGAAMAVTAILAHSLTDFNLHIPANAVLFVTLIGFTMAVDVRPANDQRAVMPLGARYALALALVVVVGLAGWFVGRTAVGYHLNALGAEVRLEHDRALEYYRRAIRVDPKSPYPYAGIGDVFLSQSQWLRIKSGQNQREQLARQAMEAYEQALQLHPYFWEAMLHLARSCEYAQEKTRVVELCQRLIESDPLNPVFYTYLGNFHMRAGELEKATQAFEKARLLQWGYGDPSPTYKLEDIRSLKTSQ